MHCLSQRESRAELRPLPFFSTSSLPSTARETYPVKHGEHHVELLLLLLLRHVARRVTEFGEEAPQVHQTQGIVLGAALLLPRPPHDPLHHVHL